MNSQWKQGSVFDAGLDLLKAPKVESAPIYVWYKSDAYVGITHAIAADSNYCRSKVIYQRVLSTFRVQLDLLSMSVI